MEMEAIQNIKVIFHVVNDIEIFDAMKNCSFLTREEMEKRINTKFNFYLQDYFYDSIKVESYYGYPMSMIIKDIQENNICVHALYKNKAYSYQYKQGDFSFLLEDLENQVIKETNDNDLKILKFVKHNFPVDYKCPIIKQLVSYRFDSRINPQDKTVSYICNKSYSNLCHPDTCEKRQINVNYTIYDEVE